MHIRLVTDIKHQAVDIRMKHGLDGNGHLYHAQISCQMTACFGYIFNQKTANFVTKLTALSIIEVQKILVGVNSL